MNISIIIPYFNNWQLTHNRLFELHNNISEPVEIILVDDASTDLECKAGVSFWQKLTVRHKIKYVKNETNLGFGGSHNRGAKAAEGTILVFLSNDVCITGNFIPKIKQIMDQYTGDVIIGGTVYYHDTGWNTITINGNKSIVPYPEGWLISCSQAMWKRIGGWDVKSYGKFDYEDVDLGAWAIYNDIPLVALNLPFLRHLSGQTVNKYHPDRVAQTEKNRKAFEEKWEKLLESNFDRL